MKKVFKSKFILSLAVIIAAVIFTFNPISAQAGNIADISFQNSPLFGETNLVPGDSVVRWVKVVNKVNDNLVITTSAANVINTGGLGDRLNLTINKGATNLYSGTMSAFFTAGVVNLGSLSAYQTGQYDYTVSFDSASDNNFQNKTLSFDISVSAQASETVGGETPTPPGGSSGGGGGYNITDLILTNINATLTNNSTDASITITWLTNKNTTSRVIYDTIPHPDLSLALPPNYGYAYSTVMDPTKVTGHSVTIPGLILGTTYYLRPLSAASPEKYGNEVAVTPGRNGTVVVQTPEIPPPTPKQAVLGEKITATSDGNNLAETGFSLFELFILVAIIITLLALRILLKRYDKAS
ncbi:MAG: hypothetical protein M0Q51_17405 [Bacteroidales bacterium]|nr:hypothetical protein [Bacteroidales bacterium]